MKGKVLFDVTLLGNNPLRTEINAGNQIYTGAHEGMQLSGLLLMDF